MSKEENIKVPEYKFDDYKDLELVPIQPIKKRIAKTMEVTETFNVYDVIAHIVKMDKAIQDKEAEVEGLKSMKKAYEDELQIIEKALGVQKMEEEYQIKLAEEAQKEDSSTEEKNEEENN